MSATSNTLEIGPPGQTIAKAWPRRFTRRYALIRRARPVESMKATLERSTTSGRSRSAKASLRTESMRGAVAMSSSPSTASSSYPSTRLRSTTSGFTAAGSLWTSVARARYRRVVQLSDYQQRSRATAVYPDAGDNLTYPALGLCGEAGEVAEKVKKALRDDGGVLTEDRRAALGAELGDVLWYVAQLATEAGLDLDTLAAENLAKLLSRQARDVLQGSGDAR